jgi:hypothetical protein
MVSALRAEVTGGASTADPALPGTSRARGRRLGSPAAVSSSIRSAATMSPAARHPSSARLAKSCSVGGGVMATGCSTAAGSAGAGAGVGLGAGVGVGAGAGADIGAAALGSAAGGAFSAGGDALPCVLSQSTGIGRFERNHADAISSKIGVVSPRSNASVWRASATPRLPGSPMTGTLGAKRPSCGTDGLLNASSGWAGAAGCCGRWACGIGRGFGSGDGCWAAAGSAAG